MKRPCIDCGALYAPSRVTPRGRCEPCQLASYRRYNSTRRDPVARRVYSSAAYVRARAEVMAGAECCAWCHRHVSECGPLTAGHLRPIRSDPEMAADPAGLAPSCRSCQEREKHRRSR